MVKAAALLETNYGLETLNIGRESTAPKDACSLFVTGKWLAYEVTLDGGWVSLRVPLMDRADQPELMVTVGDGPEGWRMLHRLIRKLEESGIKSLARRLVELGTGADGFVIG
jgi:hypothetical protein